MPASPAGVAALRARGAAGGRCWPRRARGGRGAGRRRSLLWAAQHRLPALYSPSPPPPSFILIFFFFYLHNVRKPLLSSPRGEKFDSLPPFLALLGRKVLPCSFVFQGLKWRVTARASGDSVCSAGRFYSYHGILPCNK